MPYPAPGKITFSPYSPLAPVSCCAQEVSGALRGGSGGTEAMPALPLPALLPPCLLSPLKSRSQTLGVAGFTQLRLLSAPSCHQGCPALLQGSFNLIFKVKAQPNLPRPQGWRFMAFIGVAALGSGQRLGSTQGWVCLFREKEQPAAIWAQIFTFLSTPRPEQLQRGWKGRKAPGRCTNLWGHNCREHRVGQTPLKPGVPFPQPFLQGLETSQGLFLNSLGAGIQCLESQGGI